MVISEVRLTPGVRLYHVDWMWRCPSCSREVVAYEVEHATQEAIAADARCWECRVPQDRGRILGDATPEDTD